MTNAAAAHDQGNPTRQRILAAALDAFSQHGFDGTTTRAIAAAADVNLGLIAYSAAALLLFFYLISKRKTLFS